MVILLTMDSCVLNPHSLYYRLINDNLSADYEDNYWVEDAIFMERNSRDFVSRIERINANAEAICDVLRASPDGEASPGVLPLAFAEVSV